MTEFSLNCCPDKGNKKWRRKPATDAPSIKAEEQKLYSLYYVYYNVNNSNSGFAYDTNSCLEVLYIF